MLAISQDCRQSCEIVKSCENRAVGVQISDFCLWWRHYSRRPNTSRKIVPRLFIERLFLYHCEIVARLLKKFHVWYALIARLFRDCCKIVHRKIVSISLRDCCKIVEKISRVICPNCKIVPRLLQDCCKIVENIHMCYVYSNNISWIPDAVEYILIYCSKGVFRKGSFINHVDMTGRRGVCQMSILLHKPYLVKWSTKGGGGQKCSKICPHGLWTTPKAATS